jgi:hypothetical protein
MSVALALAAALAVPVAAPPVFVAGDYALTFRTPRNTTTCALPSDWVGSNHGTVIFLRPPKGCGGVGYPSSSRGFSDDVPRIEAFYAYWLGDPGTGPSPCQRAVGRVNFVGRARHVCQTRQGRDLRDAVNARYTADAPAWVEVALVTTPQRLRADLRAFRIVTSTLAPCRVTWSNSDGKSGSFGVGKACPDDGKFF